jgi:hypothetical protein
MKKCDVMNTPEETTDNETVAKSNHIILNSQRSLAVKQFRTMVFVLCQKWELSW